MNAYIYIEGGAKGENSKELNTRCREGFRRLLEKLGFKDRLPRLKACGGRQGVYDDLVTQQKSSGVRGLFIAMLIDSEEPMKDVDRPWDHLKNVETVARWERPRGARDDQVLFMTTCMETWIVADRAALKEHYGRSMKESALPPLTKLEERSRDQVQDKLIRATRNCSNSYKKGKRSFEILAKLDPQALDSLPSFARVRRILTDNLDKSSKSRPKKGPRKS